MQHVASFALHHIPRETSGSLAASCSTCLPTLLVWQLVLSTQCTADLTELFCSLTNTHWWVYINFAAMLQTKTLKEPQSWLNDLIALLIHMTLNLFDIEMYWVGFFLKPKFGRALCCTLYTGYTFLNINTHISVQPLVFSIYLLSETQTPAAGWQNIQVLYYLWISVGKKNISFMTIKQKWEAANLRSDNSHRKISNPGKKEVWIGVI